jgi:hypothetical protein
MTVDTCYYWAVICKSHGFHNQQNRLFGHKILLGETDPYSLLPSLDEQFSVLCRNCGKEHTYKPSDVVRVESEYLDSFTPHPLFL